MGRLQIAMERCVPFVHQLLANHVDSPVRGSHLHGVKAIGRSIAAKTVVSVFVACALATTGVAPAAAADDLIVKTTISNPAHAAQRLGLHHWQPQHADVSVKPPTCWW